MESKKYSNGQVNIKDIIFVFLPIFVAVLIQYITMITDIIILFIGNVLSDERHDRTITVEQIMQQDYNQPMNMAFISVAQYLIYGLVFCTWYYKVFVKQNSKDEIISAGAIVRSSCKNIFTSIIPIFLVVAGYATQLFVDAVMTLVRPYFVDAFAHYDKLVDKVIGAYSSWIMLIAVCILAPIVEEFMFRGLIQRYGLKFLPALAAIVLQGFLFGLYHGNMVQGVYAFVLGTLLGFVAYKFDSLVPNIVLHMAINVSLLFVPQSLFESTTSTIVTAVLSGIVLLVCMVLVFRKVPKKEQ